MNAFKAAVQLAAATEYSGAPLAGPVRLTLDFILPRPKARTRKRGGNPSYPHASKPDLDNLCKSVKDALTKLIWHDDSQVAVLVASKRVASGSEQPRVEVSIMEQHA